MGNMERLEAIVARLPDAERVDVAAWVRTSYTLVAPKRLARTVLEEDTRTR